MLRCLQSCEINFKTKSLVELHWAVGEVLQEELQVAVPLVAVQLAASWPLPRVPEAVHCLVAVVAADSAAHGLPPLVALGAALRVAALLGEHWDLPSLVAVAAPVVAVLVPSEAAWAAAVQQVPQQPPPLEQGWAAHGKAPQSKSKKVSMFASFGLGSES